MKLHSRSRYLWLWALPTVLAWASIAAAGESVALSKNSKALLPIHVSSNATEAVRESAADLARLLGQMSGAEFAVEDRPAGSSTPAIIVGAQKDFPGEAKDVVWNKDVLALREQYLMRTTGGSVLLLGDIDVSVDYAVWDFLHHLGYRRYFPADIWEVVPPVTRAMTFAIEAGPVNVAVSFWPTSNCVKLWNRLAPCWSPN